MAPGHKWPTVNYDDLDMAKANQEGTYGILGCVARDSTVIDTFTEVSDILFSNYILNSYIYILFLS